MFLKEESKKKMYGREDQRQQAVRIIRMAFSK
jgi:hypothetical protein